MLLAGAVQSMYDPSAHTFTQGVISAGAVCQFYEGKKNSALGKKKNLIQVQID